MEVCKVEYVGGQWKIRELLVVATIFAKDVSRSIFEGIAICAVIDREWCSL